MGWPMHVPDGFIDAPVSLAAGGVAVIGVAVCLRGARRSLDEATAPLAGLVAVFIFAAQMFNFPVGLGTSGHLMGAALAAILIGPYAGPLAVTVVLMIQALLFADGGITALGLNIINMALVPTLVAWPVFRLVVRSLGNSRAVVIGAAAVAGWLSIVASSLAFAFEYWLGGTTALDVGAVTLAMVGVHVVIGLVEGLITALIVGAVFALRPDLVAGVKRRRAEQESVEVAA